MKKLTYLLMALCLLFVAVGCKKKADNPQPQPDKYTGSQAFVAAMTYLDDYEAALKNCKTYEEYSECSDKFRDLEVELSKKYGNLSNLPEKEMKKIEERYGEVEKLDEKIADELYLLQSKYKGSRKFVEIMERIDEIQEILSRETDNELFADNVEFYASEIGEKIRNGKSELTIAEFEKIVKRGDEFENFCTIKLKELGYNDIDDDIDLDE